jgi:beta-lactamase class D
MLTRFAFIMLLAAPARPPHAPPAVQASTAARDAGAAADSCFLFYQVGAGELDADRSPLCDMRVSPASTFKIPHALAALDAGVVRGPQDTIRFGGGPANLPEAWRHDHTLATAIRYSVVWYFQRLAERLGMERERDYLRRLAYGNEDPGSGLTTFWNGGSLEISPREQERFLVRLYEDSLPVTKRAMTDVREMLVQLPNVVTNAMGAHPFDSPWPEGVTVSAKTGSTTDREGRGVRWIVGQVKRDGRAYLFVSCVVGAPDTPAGAAIDLAARELRRRGVL